MQLIEKNMGQVLGQAIEQAGKQGAEPRVEPIIESMIEAVRCPNCGSLAERYYAINQQRTHTQCHQCDYLMTTCSLTGRVIEAYAPGIPYRVNRPCG
jgi:hypothetical protein